MYVRKNYTVSEYPEDLKSKVYLLKHFEKYIMDRLYGDYDYTFEDVERTRGMDFVQKYLRMKHVIVFKMSHDALQVCFTSPPFFLSAPDTDNFASCSLTFTITQRSSYPPKASSSPTSTRTTNSPDGLSVN